MLTRGAPGVEGEVAPLASDRSHRGVRSLRKLLGLETPDAAAADADARDTQTVRRIAAELDKLEPQEARFLAGFAYVLSRVAHADLEISPEEVDTMERLVRERGGLSSAQAALVVQIAKAQSSQFGGTEDYVVTRQFRELSTHEQRVGLLRCLFAVAVADDEISNAEDQQIAQIANELGLSQRDVAALRGEHRDQLAVLKPRG